jgi:hypothetical protein
MYPPPQTLILATGQRILIRRDSVKERIFPFFHQRAEKSMLGPFIGDGNSNGGAGNTSFIMVRSHVGLLLMPSVLFTSCLLLWLVSMISDTPGSQHCALWSVRVSGFLNYDCTWFFDDVL